MIVLGFDVHGLIKDKLGPYCKISKYLDTRKIDVITLKFEQSGFTID